MSADLLLPLAPEHEALVRLGGLHIGGFRGCTTTVDLNAQQRKEGDHLLFLLRFSGVSRELVTEDSMPRTRRYQNWDIYYRFAAWCTTVPLTRLVQFDRITPCRTQAQVWIGN